MLFRMVGKRYGQSYVNVHGYTLYKYTATQNKLIRNTKVIYSAKMLYWLSSLRFHPPFVPITLLVHPFYFSPLYQNESLFIITNVIFHLRYLIVRLLSSLWAISLHFILAFSLLLTHFYLSTGNVAKSTNHTLVWWSCVFLVK